MKIAKLYQYAHHTQKAEAIDFVSAFYRTVSRLSEKCVTENDSHYHNIPVFKLFTSIFYKRYSPYKYNIFLVITQVRIRRNVICFKISARGVFKMDVKDVIVKRFEELCEERNIRINELANISGVTPSTAYSMMDESRRDVSIRTIKKFCDGLEITLGEFFSTTDFDNLEQEIK